MTTGVGELAGLVPVRSCVGSTMGVGRVGAWAVAVSAVAGSIAEATDST